MNHIYFDKTALYRDQTGKGTKWLFYLTFIRPLMLSLTNVFSLLLTIIMSEVVDGWTNLHTFGIVLLIIGNIFTHFALVSTKPWGWAFSMVFFTVTLILQIVIMLTEPSFSNFLELPISIATLVYLYNRQGIYGIRLKNSKCPVITLPEATDLPPQHN